MRRRYLVEGVVQGVGFRYFVLRHARRLGIVGWVRNLGDGRVEAVAHGEPGVLDQFGIELRTGPHLATVTRVEVGEISLEEEAPSTFEIR